MKYRILAVFWIIAVFAVPLSAADKSGMFQYSTLSALQEGAFDDGLTIGELKKHGNFGIGTFDGLDGEMVLYEGTCWQIKSDGSVKASPDNQTSPFAAAVWFQASSKYDLSSNMTNLKALQDYLDGIIPSRNLFYAVKIAGVFPSIKTRSAPKQSKPYPRLADAFKDQSLFSMTNVSGVIIGFYCPDYARGVNMAGFHLHFISDDRKSGGHLLDCAFSEAKLEIMAIRNYTLKLPANGTFYRTDLSKDKSSELDKIEK